MTWPRHLLYSPLGCMGHRSRDIAMTVSASGPRVGLTWIRWRSPAVKWIRQTMALSVARAGGVVNGPTPTAVEDICLPWRRPAPDDLLPAEPERGVRGLQRTHGAQQVGLYDGRVHPLAARIPTTLRPQRDGKVTATPPRRIPAPPCSAEQGAVRVERGLAAEVGVEHGGVLVDPAGADQVDEPGHRLALVHRVDDHAFQATAQPDRVQRRPDRDPVVVPGPSRQHGDLAIPQFPAEPDQPGGVPRDLLDLGPGLLDPRRRVDAENLPRAALTRNVLKAGEPGDHPGLGGSGDAAHDDRVEEDAEFPFLL